MAQQIAWSFGGQSTIPPLRSSLGKIMVLPGFCGKQRGLRKKAAHRYCRRCIGMVLVVFP